EEPVPARPVGGVEAYTKMKSEALSGKVPAELAKAAQEETPTETPPAAETPAAETPAATPTAETPAATPEAPAAEEQAEPGRIRLKGLPDGHLVAAANEIARAENITFAEAFGRVAPKPTDVPVTATPSGPKLRSREDVQK